MAALDKASLTKTTPQAPPPPRTVPVDVRAVAQGLGLEIYATRLQNGVSGVLTRSKDTPSGFVIYVNENEPSYRQRFTAAHEIGHFLLHQESIGHSVEDNYLLRAEGMSNRQEAEANAYAADLLMPYELISQEIAKGHRTVEALAELFQVSRVAMSIRLGMPT